MSVSTDSRQSQREPLFTEDVEAFDLYTISSAEVVTRINDLMKTFAADHGM